MEQNHVCKEISQIYAFDHQLEKILNHHGQISSWALLAFCSGLARQVVTGEFVTSCRLARQTILPKSCLISYKCLSGKLFWFLQVWETEYSKVEHWTEIFSHIPTVWSWSGRNKKGIQYIYATINQFCFGKTCLKAFENCENSFPWWLPEQALRDNWTKSYCLETVVPCPVRMYLIHKCMFSVALG